MITSEEIALNIRYTNIRFYEYFVGLFSSSAFIFSIFFFSSAKESYRKRGWESDEIRPGLRNYRRYISYFSFLVLRSRSVVLSTEGGRGRGCFSSYNFFLSSTVEFFIFDDVFISTFGERPYPA